VVEEEEANREKTEQKKRLFWGMGKNGKN